MYLKNIFLKKGIGIFKLLLSYFYNVEARELAWAVLPLSLKLEAIKTIQNRLECINTALSPGLLPSRFPTLSLPPLPPPPSLPSLSLPSSPSLSLMAAAAWSSFQCCWCVPLRTHYSGAFSSKIPCGTDYFLNSFQKFALRELLSE